MIVSTEKSFSFGWVLPFFKGPKLPNFLIVESTGNVEAAMHEAACRVYPLISLVMCAV